MGLTGEALPGAAFWREAFTLRGAATGRVVGRTALFAGLAAVVTLVHRELPWLAIRDDVPEAAGLVLGLLLVFRTAAGYARWWEARTLWGAILNQSRSLAVGALAYGPTEHAWRDEMTRWIASFGHATRATLRDARAVPELSVLLGASEAECITASEHMPSYVVLRVGALLRRARERGELDAFAFLQLDRERAMLLDHVGGCERILKTPIPKVYSVTIRRFVVLYLCALPFALTSRVGMWSPAYAILIAYPILSLEQIGAELQNPFVVRSLSHLDLDALCLTIERNVRGMAAPRSTGVGPRDRRERD